mgnify:CR=1
MSSDCRIYANRGVQRQNIDTDYLSSCIDWCQITLKGTHSLETVIESILKIPLDLMLGDIPMKGFSGHRVIAGFGNIKLAVPTGKNSYEGYQLLMSGSGCRDYEYFLKANNETWIDFFQRVKTYDINFPRIDLAIDDYKTYLKVKDLIKLCKENLISSKFKVTTSYSSQTHTEDETRSCGETLYLGSSSSEIRIVFYEKGYEQAKKYNMESSVDWNRYEIRFRNDSARKVIDELCAHNNIAIVACGILKDKVRFLELPTDKSQSRKRLFPTYPPWEKFVNTIQKIKLSMNPNPIDEYLEKNRAWLIKNVAPSLKMQMIWDQMAKPERGILDEIANTKLNNKQLLALKTFKIHQSFKKSNLNESPFNH